MGKTKEKLLPEEYVWTCMCDNIAEIKAEIREGAEYEVGHDDDGRPEIYMGNFLQLCESCVTNYIERYDDQMDDAETNDAIVNLTDRLADTLADYESELCDEAFKDIKERG